MPARSHRSLFSLAVRLMLASLLATLVLVGTNAAKPQLAHANAPTLVPLYDRWTDTTQVFQDSATGEITVVVERHANDLEHATILASD